MCGNGGAGGNNTSSERPINTGYTNLKSRRIAYVSIFLKVSRRLLNKLFHRHDASLEEALAQLSQGGDLYLANPLAADPKHSGDVDLAHVGAVKWQADVFGFHRFYLLRPSCPGRA
jgi:hypothetical protein